MTTFFCKPRDPRGQSRESMGRHGKVTTPQVTLSFPSVGPPILDPSPTPTKSRSNRNSWSGQMWSHLASMFTPQPPVYWVNPHLVRECPPPLISHYNNPPHQYTMPPPALNPGGGLWHVAPPGNQQQQMMMDPLLMLQENNANDYFPTTKTDSTCFYPMSKTNGFYPTAKVQTDSAYLMTKVDTDSCFPGSRDTKSFCQMANTNGGTHTTSWYSVDPSTTTTTTTTSTSKPLNPYAQEWVPPGYMTTFIPDTANITASVPLVAGEETVEMPDHHSAPFISTSPQDFSQIMEKKVEQVQMNACLLNPLPLPPPPPPPTSTPLLPSGLVSECQLTTEHNKRDTVNNVAQLSPSGTLTKGLTASSEVENPSQSSDSKSLLCYQEKSESEGGPSDIAPINPGATNTASPVLASLNVKNSDIGVAFSPQSPTSSGISEIVTRPDPVKSSSSTISSSQSPHQNQQVCVKLPSSLDSARPDPTQSTLHTSSRFESPKGQSPTQTSNSASEAWKSSLESQSMNATSPEGQSSIQTSSNAYFLRPGCQNLETDVVGSLEVPLSAKEGLDSASKSNSTKRVPDNADRNMSASLSYAIVVERPSPSPSPPPEQGRYRGVEQPIPKIFQRDRTPPREAPTPVVKPQRIPELFRRPSKSQRTCSRKFLQELKESSHNGDDSDLYASSPSSVSSTSSSSCSPSSPSHIIPAYSFSSSPSQKQPSSPIPISPLRRAVPIPKSTPQAIPMSPSTPVSPNGPAESPNRVRSESESSTASLDIDFVDDVDHIPSTHPPSIPVSASASRRPINRFLACILGSGDSESEEEEEDWDDWDEVCVEEDALSSPQELDDSWETFGLQMLVVQCRTEPSQCAKEPVKQCQNGQRTQCQAGAGIQCQCELSAQCRMESKECRVEPDAQCQNGLPPQYQVDLTAHSRNVPPAEGQVEDGRTDQNDRSYLSEINEKWEREVGQEVQRKSAPRVTFGTTKVHPMIVWSHAYREARRGPWEQQARDRARFKQRISTAEMALSWVLQPSHRTAVYERLCTTNTTTTATTTIATTPPS